MAEQHAHQRSSWFVVGLIALAAVLLGLAVVLQNIPLGIVAIVIGVAGLILGGVTRIMDDAY